MKTTDLIELKKSIERKLRRKITDGQFALLLGYASKTGDAREAYSRLWELRNKKYLPSRIAERCDELSVMTAAELNRKLSSHSQVKSFAPE